MLRAILNKSRRQNPTRHQLYGHQPPITKTIQVRRTRHEGHCWRSRDELRSDVLQWTPTYGWAKAGRPARTYIQQLCEDTGCNPEDLPEAMNDRETWQERVRDIHAGGTTWWWYCFLTVTSIHVIEDILTFVFLFWYHNFHSPIVIPISFSIHKTYHISLNLFLCLHLKISSFRLFNSWLVTLYLIILIFSSRQSLNQLLKLSGIEVVFFK